MKKFKRLIKRKWLLVEVWTVIGFSLTGYLYFFDISNCKGWPWLLLTLPMMSPFYCACLIAMWCACLAIFTREKKDKVL
jgi:hypothetical protein